MDARVLSLVLGAVLVGAAGAAGAAVSHRQWQGRALGLCCRPRRSPVVNRCTPSPSGVGRRHEPSVTTGPRLSHHPSRHRGTGFDVSEPADPEMDARVLSLVLGAPVLVGLPQPGRRARRCLPSVAGAALWGLSLPAASVSVVVN